MVLVSREFVQTHTAGFRAYAEAVLKHGTRTLDAYGEVVADFLEFLPTGTDVLGVTRGTVLRFLEGAARTQRGEPSSYKFNNALAGVRSLFDYLVQVELMKENPTKGIRQQEVDAPPRIPLTLDEIVALVDALGRSDRNQVLRNVAIAQVFIHCGLRVSEVVGLKRHQVDLHPDRRMLVGIRVKGRKRLSVPINDLAAEALEKYLAERDLLPVDCDEVFLSNQLRKMSVRAVQSLISAAGKAAGIERPVTPHLLRHTTVTMVQELGAVIQTAQTLVGHASIATTERYTHLGTKFVRQAVETLSDAVKRRTRELRAAAS